MKVNIEVKGAAKTLDQRYSPCSTVLELHSGLVDQVGQKPRFLQENATSRSKWQLSQRTRRNPCSWRSHFNFSLADMRQEVASNRDRAELEAFGGVTDETLRPVVETGVDFISIGTLTKDVRALGLSMRLD